MAHVLPLLFVFGAFIIIRTGLFGRRRTITPRAVPEARAEWRSFAPADDDDDEVIDDEPPETDDVAPTPPISDAVPAGHPAYLLNVASARAAPDRMSAAMAMMSGPGICTPADG